MSKRCCAEMCFNSQTINKNVTYFGFPKYEEFAVKWAIAANRGDLLEKKLSCITKYYLCSEHFSDDCFLDPPNNTRLKKTQSPLNIPVPTIFKCNIDKYIPDLKKRVSGTEFNEETENAKRTAIYGQINDFSMNRTKEGISWESLSVFHDHHYNYPDISSCSASLFNDIEVSINDLSNENSFDNIVDCDQLTNIADESICRLCAKAYSSTEYLTDLTTKPGIYDALNALLPNQIQMDDNLSQLACTNCLEKLNTCIKIVDSFKGPSYKFKDMESTDPTRSKIIYYIIELNENIREYDESMKVQ